MAIGRALAHGSALRWLSLAYNSIGDVGAMAIGRSLDDNARLRYLGLAHCGVGNRGAQVIAEGLHENYALEHLDVSGNAVGDYGGRALLRALNASRRPRKLVMDDCAFDAKGPSFRKGHTTSRKTRKVRFPNLESLSLESLSLSSSRPDQVARSATPTKVRERERERSHPFNNTS